MHAHMHTLAHFLLALFGSVNLKVAAALLAGFFVYDIFFVFITPYLTKNNDSVMVKAATVRVLCVCVCVCVCVYCVRVCMYVCVYLCPVCLSPLCLWLSVHCTLHMLVFCFLTHVCCMRGPFTAVQCVRVAARVRNQCRLCCVSRVLTRAAFGEQHRE